MAPVVCRFAGGKSDFVPVDVGASDNTHTIVKSGLSENDKIVIGPYKVLDTLKHAAALKDDAATTATTTTLTAKPKA